MAADIREIHSDLEMHLFSDDEPSAIRDFGEKQPELRDIRESTSIAGLDAQMDAHLLIGFIGFSSSADLVTFRTKHGEIRSRTDLEMFPYSIYLSPKKSGLYIFRRYELGSAEIGSASTEFEEYLKFIDSHWGDKED